MVYTKPTNYSNRMNLNGRILKFTILFFLSIQACSVQKSRNDVSKAGLFFHNLTAKYNGYYNANVLYQEAEIALTESYKDDYNKILELYEYNGVADASSQAANLDIVIKKLSTVINLHRPSHWVPDSYLLIGQSQYMKQQYEAAEETFKYMVNNYDRLHLSTKKKTKEQAAKERAVRVREQQEKREEEKIAKEKEKKKATKAREEQQKERKKATKEKQKEREAYVKARQKAAKAGKPLPPRPSSTTVKPVSAKDTSNTKTIAKESANPKKESAKKDKEEKEGESLAATARKKGKPSKNHRPVLQDAQLWLAKTYIMRKNSIAAGIVLSQLRSDEGLYEEIRPEIPVLQAYNHIKAQEYEEAIPFLKEALANDGLAGKQKARIAFVLGQLMAKQKNAAESYAAFNNVSDYNPSYELQFFARLFAAQQGVASGKANKEGLLSDLKKLSRDDKNLDYGVAIAHSMALVYLADGNREEARAQLIKALDQRGDNTQKTESFYLLASMYYEDAEYLKAKNYFDSTLTVMNDKDIRRPEVDKYAQSLTDIAKNLAVIQIQDSMLRVSGWSEKEQKQWAKKVVKDRENLSTPKVGLLDQPRANSNSIPTSVNPTGSKTSFFAYDDKILKKGIKDFEKIWGAITLQDNWRVSQKAKNNFASTNFNSATGDPSNQSKAEDDTPDTGEEISRLLAEVPNTEEQKNNAKEKIRNSMYTLGILYREKLENHSKAIAILEDVLIKYPNSEIEQDVLYQVYLASMQNQDLVRAEKYKDRLVRDYPGSKYAQAILHPGSVAAEEDRDAKINRYYDETYTMYNKGQCEIAMNRVQAADSLFKENPLKAKFAMLGVLCTGKSQGKDAYINALKDFIGRYPQSVERDKAKDMLRYLMGDEKAFETSDILKKREDPNAYEYVADELHYVIAIVHDKKESTLSDLKISISDFNQRFFQNDDLRISNIFLDANTENPTTPIIMVRKFDDAARAKRYYQTVMNNERLFIKPEINKDIFAISQSNYRKLNASKDVDGYKSFFAANYKE